MLTETLEAGLALLLAIPTVALLLAICWLFGKVVDRG
jgi:hypothetical protein